jgi:hypothetical protein
MPIHCLTLEEKSPRLHRAANLLCDVASGALEVTMLGMSADARRTLDAILRTSEAKQRLIDFLRNSS